MIDNISPLNIKTKIDLLDIGSGEPVQTGVSDEFLALLSKVSERAAGQNPTDRQDVSFYLENAVVVDPHPEQIARKTAEYVNAYKLRKESQEPSQLKEQAVEERSHLGSSNQKGNLSQSHYREAGTLNADSSRNQSSGSSNKDGLSVFVQKEGEGQLVKQLVDDIAAKESNASSVDAQAHLQTTGKIAVGEHSINPAIALTKNLLAESINTLKSLSAVKEGVAKIDSSIAKSTEVKGEKLKDKQTSGFPKKAAMKTLEKVEQALKEAMKSSDGKTISLRLDPPSLGSLKVDVTLKEGSLYARIVADSREVASFLRDKGHEVQRMLRGLGLNVDRVNVFVGSDSGNQTYSQENKEEGFHGFEQNTGNFTSEIKNNLEILKTKYQTADSAAWIA